MRVHRNILPRCWVIQAEQEKGGKDMTLPEQERERFCQVLHHSRTSLYRLAFSITRNSSDAQEAVATRQLLQRRRCLIATLLTASCQIKPST